MRVLIAICWQLLVVVSYCNASKSEPDTAVIGILSTGETSQRPVTDVYKQAAERPASRVKQRGLRQVNGRSVTIEEIEAPAKNKLRWKQSVDHDLQSQREVLVAKEAFDNPELIIVSATVYGAGRYARSKVRLQHNGKHSTAWFEADFRLMTGFSQFRANGRSYFIISSTVKANGKPETDRLRRFRHRGFAVTDGAKADDHARRIFADLQKLYRVEKDRLRRAYQLRQRHAATRKTKPLPKPSPQPVTIRFWKRNVEQERREQKQLGRGAKS